MANHKIQLTAEVMRALDPVARRRGCTVEQLLTTVGIEHIDASDPRNDQAAFLDLLLAAMCDATTTGNMTQIQTKLVPPGQDKEKIVRIIVVPEDMQHVLGGS